MKREALCIALTAAACGGVTSTDDDMMMGDPADTLAPKIVSTTPTTDEVGIGADTKIVVVFSEPMDPATVEAAYMSEKLPLDKVSTEWNADQTVLTISPDQSLLYGNGNGNSPNPADRLTYSITIGAGATDLVGNALEADFVLSFATKVRMFTTATLTPPLSCTTLGGATLAESVNVIAGDASLNNVTYRGYLSFDLSNLPADVTIEDAKFAARQMPIEGTPYASFGALQVYHLSFTTMNGVSNVAASSKPGVFSEDGTIESKSIDVSSQVADDIAHRVERGNLSQYRLQFDTLYNNDGEFDRATFAKDTFEMSIHFLVD
jgi:hypothetical protein